MGQRSRSKLYRHVPKALSRWSRGRGSMFVDKRRPNPQILLRLLLVVFSIRHLLVVIWELCV